LAGCVGWDWASLQLNDGRELMVYRMRRADGSCDPVGTTMASIDIKGAVTHYDASQFSWSITRRWTSPQTKAVYPIGVVIETQGQRLELRPVQDAQELDNPITGLAYWEGACDVLDPQGNVIGRAFLELAGYAGDLARHLRGR
jgi:predicted secreted hydrolase